MVWPEKSEALTALLLSIIGLAMCGGVFCPFGWWMANREMAGINAGLRDPDNRGMTTAAKVIGIIGTAVLLLSIVMVGLAVILFFASAR